METVACSVWSGCYDDGWNGVIVPEAYAHPAKMARGLLKRIIRRMLDEGWVRRGDLVGDPFGGIGSTGILCSYAGLRSVSVELEPRFVALAGKNFALHDAKWKAYGDPLPVMLQGDSRCFAALVGECGAVVTSPPFSPDQPCASQTKELKDYDAFTSFTKRDHIMASHGQISIAEPDTYWTAMPQVYSQMRLAMRPGAVAAIVVKDFVRARKRVPLCDQTVAMLEKCGFDVFERTRAMLVKEKVHKGLFGEQRERKERKSFFRRLAERKGSPRIDWEEVIWARKEW